MQIRIVQFGSRNPFVRAALTIVAVALLVAVLVFGLALLAVLAAVSALGVIALVARRLLGVRHEYTAPGPVLDPSREVFPTGRSVPRGRLPEDAG